MWIIAVIIIVSLTTLAWLAWHAPEGYEADDGFHYGANTKSEIEEWI